MISNTKGETILIYSFTTHNVRTGRYTSLTSHIRRVESVHHYGWFRHIESHEVIQHWSLYQSSVHFTPEILHHTALHEPCSRVLLVVDIYPGWTARELFSDHKLADMYDMTPGGREEQRRILQLPC